MTKIKLKGKKYSTKGQVGWHEPQIELTAEDINLQYYVVMINGKTYTIWSRKFKKAFDDDRIFRMLMQ